MKNIPQKYALDQKRMHTTEEFVKTNLNDSLHMLIQAEIASLNDNSHYNFNIGNIDFDLFKIPGEWEKNFSKTIHAKITQSVNTLQNVDVAINKSEVSPNFKYIKYPVIKFYLDMHINAINAITHEDYYFHTCLFLSPM